MGDVEMMDEAQREEYEKRKRRDLELKKLREHDAAMAKARQEARALAKANEELRKQLEALRKEVEAAEAERDGLRQMKAQIQQQVEAKANRRSAEIERVKKLAEKQQGEADEAAKAKASAAAEAAAKAAADVRNAADRIGDTLFQYTWAEQLKRPLTDELEAERTAAGISKEEWQQRLVILNKHGKAVKLPVDFALLQDQFYMTVVMKAPPAAKAAAPAAK